MAQAASVERPNMSAEEWRIRVDLAACYRLVAQYGWDDMIFTHISARIPGPEHHFLINPYGMLFEEITASSLVKVDLQGNKLDDSPFPVNPAGFTIHSAIHQVREDAHCVIHLHTLDGTAVSSQKEGLLPLNQTALLIRQDLAFHDYEGVALDLDERERLQRDLGPTKSLMLLRNHGTMALGPTVADAFMRIYFLERACSMQVRTLSGGTPIYDVTHDAAQKTAQQGGNQDMMQMVTRKLAWPALLRGLDRRDPSYRN
ncbi:MAG TPA: class II aldolase/adducin family protein [Azospirillaceae bacterium]|nr:class II aldolase/adducin family protein [Azospirillaceae bacterium]